MWTLSETLKEKVKAYISILYSFIIKENYGSHRSVMINIYFDIYQSLDDKNLQVLSLKGSMVETEPEAEMVWELMLPLLQERKKKHPSRSF